ncbi:MAG TPA: DUF4339 domain-containing protein [Thermoanaerobaculia bacterium]|nr:DUF4339 domain-containing protein [Thermoanaerobaculia bacterium]
MITWYYRHGTDQLGPMTWAELLSSARSGALAPDDLVWNPTMPEWKAASLVPGLFPTAAPPPPASKPIGDDPIMRLVLPVGRSPWAIVAGYLGLFAFLIVPAPLALVAGLLAVRDIRRNPHKHGMGRAVFGIIIGAIGTILLILMIVFRNG